MNLWHMVKDLIWSEGAGEGKCDSQISRETEEPGEKREERRGLAVTLGGLLRGRRIFFFKSREKE